MSVTNLLKTNSLTCPKCRRVQYFCCGNPNCVDVTRVPKGKKPQVILPNDGLGCPYCGFSALMDYWEERAMAIISRKEYNGFG